MFDIMNLQNNWPGLEVNNTMLKLAIKEFGAAFYRIFITNYVYLLEEF